MARMWLGASGLLVALAIVAAATGCAGKQSRAAAAPSPTASPGAGRSAPLDGLADIRDYLERVRPMTSELAATLAMLPDAVRGLSAKPDGTWTASSRKLDRIATQLDRAASSLAALTPPDGLRSVQAAAVSGIRSRWGAVCSSGFLKITCTLSPPPNAHIVLSSTGNMLTLSTLRTPLQRSLGALAFAIGVRRTPSPPSMSSTT